MAGKTKGLAGRRGWQTTTVPDRSQGAPSRRKRPGYLYRFELVPFLRVAAPLCVVACVVVHLL